MTQILKENYLSFFFFFLPEDAGGKEGRGEDPTGTGQAAPGLRSHSIPISPIWRTGYPGAWLGTANSAEILVNFFFFL
jgi:hypothetical protein